MGNDGNRRATDAPDRSGWPEHVTTAILDAQLALVVAADSLEACAPGNASLSEDGRALTVHMPPRAVTVEWHLTGRLDEMRVEIKRPARVTHVSIPWAGPFPAVPEDDAGRAALAASCAERCADALRAADCLVGDARLDSAQRALEACTASIQAQDGLPRDRVMYMTFAEGHEGRVRVNATDGSGVHERWESVDGIPVHPPIPFRSMLDLHIDRSADGPDAHHLWTFAPTVTVMPTRIEDPMELARLLRDPETPMMRRSDGRQG